MSVEALKEVLAPEDLREFYRLGGTDKRLSYVFAFIETSDPQEAHRRAGYSESTATSGAYQTRSHPSVQFLLARLGHHRLAEDWTELQPLYTSCAKELGKLALKSKDEKALKYACDVMRPIMQASLEDADKQADRAKKALEAAERAKVAATKLTSDEVRDYLRAMTDDEREVWRQELLGSPSTPSGTESAAIP